MSPASKLVDYVDVAERIRTFKAQYPEGTLQSWRDPMYERVGDKFFVIYSAAAYRTPDDERPGIGWAWEPVPGPTPFTQDSELQNAETSAWGRAIVALGFETKKIASAEEVRNRQTEERSSTTAGATPVQGNPDNSPTKAQKLELTELLEQLYLTSKRAPNEMTWTQFGKAFTEERFGKRDGLNSAEYADLIEYLKPWLKDAAPFDEVEFAPDMPAVETPA